MSTSLLSLVKHLQIAQSKLEQSHTKGKKLSHHFLTLLQSIKNPKILKQKPLHQPQLEQDISLCGNQNSLNNLSNQHHSTTQPQLQKPHHCLQLKDISQRSCWMHNEVKDKFVFQSNFLNLIQVQQKSISIHKKTRSCLQNHCRQSHQNGYQNRHNHPKTPQNPKQQLCGDKNLNNLNKQPLFSERTQILIVTFNCCHNNKSHLMNGLSSSDNSKAISPFLNQHFNMNTKIMEQP